MTTPKKVPTQLKVQAYPSHYYCTSHVQKEIIKCRLLSAVKALFNSKKNKKVSMCSYHEIYKQQLLPNVNDAADLYLNHINVFVWRRFYWLRHF